MTEQTYSKLPVVDGGKDEVAVGADDEWKMDAAMLREQQPPRSCNHRQREMAILLEEATAAWLEMGRAPRCCDHPRYAEWVHE